MSTARSARPTARRIDLRHGLALAVVALLAAAGATGQAPAPPGGVIEVAALNRAYDDVAPEIVPVVEGPLTVALRSPSHRLVLRRHRLRLEPGAGGSHAAELMVEFSGKGLLVADVSALGLGTRMQEEVIVPPQATTLEGRARVARVSGGYLVTPEQLPKSIAVQIRSQLGNRIVAWCDRASLVPLGELDCRGLERSLSRAVVPLPQPGEGYLLEDAELTPEDRRRLDAYLAAR